MINDDQTEITLFFVIDDDGAPVGKPWQRQANAVNDAKRRNEHEGGTRFTVSAWTYAYQGQQLVWAPEWDNAPTSARRVLGLEEGP